MDLTWRAPRAMMMPRMPETSQPRTFGDYVVERELGRGGMTMQCNTLIGKKPGRVPWARCVQSVCTQNPYVAEAMIGRAPAEMRMSLEASCPQIRGKK